MADCEGKSKAGKACRYAARFPEGSPRWCQNCDPSPEAVERRRRAGGMRKRRFARAASVDQTDEELIGKPQEPTIDYIVDLSLAAADKVATGKLTGEQGRAMKLLYQVALEGMKARGVVGDARGAGKETKAPPPKSSLGEDNPPAVTTGTLEQLSRELELDS